METAVVLDYDETLAHTKEDAESFKEIQLLQKDNTLSPALRARLYAIDIYNSKNKLSQRMWGVKRPYLDLFLRFCFAAFDYVILWSAGTALYVDRVEKIVFRDAGHPSPHYVFSHDDCVDKDDDKVKPLEHLYKLAPELKKKLPLDNIVIMDNKESNFETDEERALWIDDYSPEATLKDITADEKSLLAAIGMLARRRYAMGPLSPSKHRIVSQCINDAQRLIGDV